MHLGWLTKFWIRFCIKLEEKDYFHFMTMVYPMAALDYSINKNILLTLGVWFTDYGNHKFLPFSWEIQRICVYDHIDTREQFSFKTIFELLNLRENLTSGFSKTRMYLISQIEESWRLRMSWVLEVEFWWQSYRNRRLHTDWVLHWFWANCDSIGKKLVLIQDVFNSILSSLW